MPKKQGRKKKKKPLGGAREGAGRPSKWGEPMNKLAVSIPASADAAIRQVAEQRHGGNLTEAVVAAIRAYCE